MLLVRQIVFGALVAASFAQRLKNVVVPDLLLDLYRSDMITRCKLDSVALCVPVNVNTDKANQLKVTYNLSSFDPLTAAHVVFHVAPSSANTLSCRSIKATLNEAPVTLSARPIKTALVAKVDHAKLQGIVELLIDLGELSQCELKLNEIFMLTNIDESCRVWQHLMLRGGTRFGRALDTSALDSDAPQRRSTRSNWSSQVPELVKLSPKMCDVKVSRPTSRCEVKEFKVDFRQLEFIRDDFIIYPDEFNMGMCKGNCSYTQCNNNGIVRHLLNGIVDTKAPSKEMPGPATCVPTKLGPLQVLVANERTNAIEMQLLRSLVVKECGCI
ncbi:bone morphogenetic protein 6-like [Tropilaelaps mercedesae]|uniref:Bone morphogenetic protein 6-like n=1 Tax=Tropilaelaps mercedesae TaxID=418985 RepID=A0A1V9XML6_9ACAR|nr:bone morphogenetic protein 6-like [Tropilaelaps mercedesae]